MMAAQQYDVIIIGAGVVGLTLAHSLKEHGISHLILERDGGLDARGNGWGITIAWAKPDLKRCISEDLYEKLPTISVDYEMTTKDTGHYKFLNLKNLAHRYLSPAEPGRLRVRREGLRQLLVPGMNIHWGAKVRDIDFKSEVTKITLADGTEYRGKLIVGADGANSTTRRFLCPETGGNIRLPLLFIGVINSMTPEQVAPLQEIDPMMFQGCHEDSGVFMYYSTLSTPETNGSAGTKEPYFQAQTSISWKPRYEEELVPTTSAERLQRMRELCSDMAPPVSKMINDIPDGVEAIEIKLQDWPCLDWPNHDGRITLAGDAAHAMTMYRGEAANYGITDAADLAEKLIAMSKGELTQKAAVLQYEKELRVRSQRGVLMSRQACMDAHDFQALKDDSPLLSLS